jgi:hypothetical protein
MDAVLILLAISALTGLTFGFASSSVAILVSGTILSILSATVLQKTGVGPLAAIATIIARLTVIQLGYLARSAPDTFAIWCNGTNSCEVARDLIDDIGAGPDVVDLGCA